MQDTKEPPDEILALRAAAGEREAFGILVARYHRRLVAFCGFRLGSEAGQDAAQEVLVRVFRALPSFRPGSSFSSWLFAIAANRVRTRARRRVEETQRLQRMALDPSRGQATADPGDQALEALEAQRLRDAVRRLPRSLRRAVELYYFAELSIEETARTMGLGTEAVKSRLFRARKALKQEFLQPSPTNRGIL